MTGVFTTSHDPETCDGCGNAIPAWDTYVLTWVGKAEDVRRWHLDCHPADVALGRMTSLDEEV